MANLAYWTAFDAPENKTTLIYMIQHENREQANANWKAFLSDPDWQQISAESTRVESCWQNHQRVSIFGRWTFQFPDDQKQKFQISR